MRAKVSKLVDSAAIDHGQLAKFKFRQSSQDGPAEQAACINPPLPRGDYRTAVVDVAGKLGSFRAGDGEFVSFFGCE